jgi:hypothetical protein
MTGSETGHVTGTADKDYNLIWFTGKCLNNGPARLGWQPSRAGQDHHEQPGSESGDQPDTQPASGGDGDCGETTGGMDTMFGRLRDAAAKHDDDCDLLPLIQDGAATGKQPSGCRDGHRDRPGDIAG